MRKNEKAKVRIKKKRYGFGGKDNEQLRFPKGFELLPSTEESGGQPVVSEARQRLVSKGIIYEVKLHDWYDRVDLLGEGHLLK
jgi:hypothetical protein